MTAPRKILTGLLYTAGGGYSARVLSVALTVLLRKQLGPGVFGDVVLGVTVYSLLSSLRELGLPHALLHFGELSTECVSTHFCLNVLSAFLGAVFSSGVASLLGWWYPQTFSWTVLVVVWVFSGFSVVRSLSLTSESLLRMEFEFGRLSLYHGLGTGLALLCGLLAARAGWGAWSLLLGGWGTYSVLSLVYVVVFSLAVYASRPVDLRRLRPHRAWARRLMGYSVWIWAGWVLQTFVWYYDKLVVGLAVGKTELALYENACWVVQLPTAVISHIIFTYTNALYSRYQNQSERLAEAYSEMMGMVVRLSWPVALLLLLNAREIMALMPEWGGSAPVVVWLAGYAFLRPLMDEGLGLLWAVGDTRGSARVFAGQALVALVAVPALGLAWGLAGVAVSTGLVCAAGLAGLLRAVGRHVRTEWARVFAVPAVGSGVALVVGLAYSLCATGSPMLDLAVRSTAATAAYGLVLCGCERAALRANLARARRILSRSPGDGGAR